MSLRNLTHETMIEKLERENHRLRQELHSRIYTPATEWGNCRRGCPPAYLDKGGFCSPACALGAPRGKFVTVGISVGRITSREPNIPTKG
jgi:hypothetical protein